MPSLFKLVLSYSDTSDLTKMLSTLNKCDHVLGKRAASNSKLKRVQLLANLLWPLL